MQRVIDFLRRLGVVEGMTFRLVREDGVGMLIEPNPQPNRMQPRAVPVPPHRVARRRASGHWAAKLLHLP